MDFVIFIEQLSLDGTLFILNPDLCVCIRVKLYASISVWIEQYSFYHFDYYCNDDIHIKISRILLETIFFLQIKVYDRLITLQILRSPFKQSCFTCLRSTHVKHG